MKISYNLDISKDLNKTKYSTEYRAVKQVHEGEYANAAMEYDPCTDLERVRRAIRAHLLYKGIKDVGVTVMRDEHLVIVYKKEVK